MDKVPRLQRVLVSGITKLASALNIDWKQNMREFVRKSWKKFLIVGFGVIIAVILFFNSMLIRRTTYMESSQHLDELSRQMAASIEKQSRSQWNMLNMFYQYSLNLSNGDWKVLEDYADLWKKEWGFDNLCFVDEDAMYYDKTNSFSLLSHDEISSRLLTKREPVILDNVFFKDGNKLIFLTPVEELIINEKKICAIGAVYNSQNLFDILDIEAFEGNAVMYITHQDGVVLFRTNQENAVTGYNLFNSLAAADFERGSVGLLKKNIGSGDQDLMTVHLEKCEYYLNHTPIGVDDWQLITMVPMEVVSGRVIKSSMITFVCLLMIGALIISAFILIYSDSAKKVLLAEETARRAAENANLSKSRFLSNMSHDIRTPMNAIIGMSKIATDHIEEPDKVRDCLRKIDMSGRLLVGLINDILDMSKIESGKMTLNQDTASLVDLMQNLVGITQPAIRQKNQVFHIRLHDIRHENVIVDAIRMNQIMINLLGNAVKFTPEEGSISLDVTELPAEDERYAHYIFRVADTGIGISPEFLDHIFTSFTREREDRVGKIEGSGLGMAITKMIVTMMGGSITVESELGNGSVFTVELDLLIAGAPEELKLPDIRVLVADDDAETCRSAAGYLKEMAVKADLAFGGKEAVQKAGEAAARGDGYHMILLDWRMPDLGGTDTARKIRELVGADIPILLVSAYDWSGIELEANDAGIDGFIQKPFFKSTLYHNIRKYYFQSEQEQPAGDTERIDLSGRRLLVAEDNEINLEIAQEILADTGAVVETACDGAEAVKMFKNSPVGYYSLILMDIKMPIMNGYEATKAIRKMERQDAGSIPIFAMTADAFADDIEAAKNAGMNAHLAKPLDIETMMREINRYLN